MRLYYECGTRQIHKGGEELCGDNVVVSRRKDSVIMALADGLGSGVKANILATLTTRIATQLLENDLPLGEVVQTLTETLPVCSVRKMAYSTFAIAQFFPQGTARVVEFDTPSTIMLRGRHVKSVDCEERTIEGKAIREAVLKLRVGDWVIFVSDGILNAGIGGLYPLGWGWDHLARFVEEQAHPDISAQQLADKVAGAVEDLYAGAPGDDVSVVVIKVRRKLVATVLTGPPETGVDEESYVSRLTSRGGRLAVCGGTTAKIVARCLGKPLEVDLSTITEKVPALARLDGIDLVTEGILTLTQAGELLRSGATRETVRFQTDGAASLVRFMLEVDHVHFIVGMAINPAHQNPDLPGQLGIRSAAVRDIVEYLRDRGTEVTIETI